VKARSALSLMPLLTAAALLAAVAAPVARGAAPPAAADPAAAPPGPDLEAQLEAARRKLEAAAHEFAELSAQMSAPLVAKFMAYGGEPWRASLGVQLDGAAAGGGAVVRDVSPGGPAAEAGMRAGDVIVAVNGTSVKGGEPAHQVVEIMQSVKPGAKVSVRVLRDGQPRDFTVTARSGPVFLAGHGSDFDFAPMPPMPPMPSVEPLPPLRGMMARGPLADLELVTVTPQLGRYFGADKGVLVVRAPADGALKLEEGDVIVAIDGRQPASGSHATRILSSYQPGEQLALRVIRDHKSLDLQARMPQPSAPAPRERPALRGGVGPSEPPQPRAIAIAPRDDQT
jgi:predicted metalloprotease with PDZ domain